MTSMTLADVGALAGGSGAEGRRAGCVGAARVDALLVALLAQVHVLLKARRAPPRRFWRKALPPA